MINAMDMEKWSEKMEVSSREYERMESKMVKARYDKQQTPR